MAGFFVDNIIYGFKSTPKIIAESMIFLETDYGNVRLFDTGGDKPIIINVPDGPNVIEHQLEIIKELSNRYRVICFEYPGLGFSYPNSNYDYSCSHGVGLLGQIMELLNIDQTALLFSCSNGFYALSAAGLEPNKFTHIFLSQTPSMSSMLKWTEKSIPNILKMPVIGQFANILNAKKLAKIWYKYALPKETDRTSYQQIALNSINNGGCFCLSSLVQGLKKDEKTSFSVKSVPVTLVWGKNDFTHRKTDCQSISEHAENCEVIEFDNCGHFPEIEYTSKYAKLIYERL